MKQIVEQLNKIAKKIDENVDIPDSDLIIDSLDAITKAYGGTPNDSNLIVDKLEDIAGVAHGGGGGSSNEEYIILPESEYFISSELFLPLLSPLPEPFPKEINVKMDNTSYIFERTYTEDGYIYSNSDIDNLFFVADSGLLFAFPGSGESYQKTLEISVQREPRNYSIFTVTLVNATQIGTIYEESADVSDFISDPPVSLLYYLDNGEIINASNITIPPETSLTLDIILSVDDHGGFFYPLSVSGISSNLINCTLNQSQIVFPEIFGTIINASGTITFEGAR